ncbi:hypothetical protein [Nocardia sp. NPDC056000]|uniref:hypothetical protein n=1 Tax=Nocardia sp. NPDC056000 TaxID=3345674 RepID=UPI0035E2B309
MRHQLDIDEPIEIIAAAGRVTAAATAVTGRATAALGELAPVGSPHCTLDHALLGVLHWVKSSCTTAATSDGTGATAAHRFVVQAATALDTADEHGRATVHDSGDRI